MNHYRLQDEDMSPTQLFSAKSVRAFSRSCVRTFIVFLATLGVVLPTFEIAAAEVVDECLAREGKTPIILEESTSCYERKLFVTPAEVARYVFLTNRYDDGDRSAAIYRAPHKKGALPGDIWLTATVAADSVRGDHRNVRVRRFDAPLPDPTANVLHELWLTVLKHSRTDEEAIPCAPTGVFYVTTEGGTRLKGVTVAGATVQVRNSFCDALIDLGESLIEYARLPAPRRMDAARKIEEESHRLLKRVTRTR